MAPVIWKCQGLVVVNYLEILTNDKEILFADANEYDV